MDIKGEIDSNTVTVGNLKALVTSIDIYSRQKTNKEIVALNGTLNQMDLIDIFRAFHAKAVEYTHRFQVTWKIF